MKSVFCIGVIGLLTFAACSSAPAPKPLDLKTITGDIPVYSVSLLIRKDIDQNEKGKDFIQSFFAKNMGSITQMLAEKGIKTDDGLFTDEFGESPKIELQVLDIYPQFIVHRYYWNKTAVPETRLELLLNFVLLDDGTMPLEATVKKNDPEYEPGYAKTVTLYLKFQGQ